MKKAALVSLFAFVLSFGVVLGQEFSPQGSSLELKLENIVITDNKIDGKITAKNVSDNPVNNVSFSHTLWEGLKTEKRFIDGAMRDVFVDRSVILAGKKDDAIFSLLPGEERATSFTLPYSSHIESGEYRLLARVVGIATGSIFGETTRNIDLEGDNQFLRINYDTCRVIRGDKEYFVKAGPNFYPGEKPKVSCEIANPTNKDISATAQFDVAVFSIFDSLQYSSSKTTGDSIVFPAKSAKKIILEIDSPKEPQVYEAGLTFIDENNQSLSPYAFFRWVITGPSARIENVTADKTFYQKGDTAKVKVEFYGSMDLFWRNIDESSITSGVPQELLSGTPLQKPVLALQITDAKGNVCGQAEQAISDKIEQSGLLTQEFAVSIQKTCQDPKFSVSFKEADKNLASLDYQTISSASEKQAAKPAAFGTKKTGYLIAGLIVLAALLVLFIRKKRPFSPVLLVLILAAVVLSLFAISRPNVLADSPSDQIVPIPWPSQRYYPNGQGYITRSLPEPDSIHTSYFNHNQFNQSGYLSSSFTINQNVVLPYYLQPMGDSIPAGGCNNDVYWNNNTKFLLKIDFYADGAYRDSHYYEVTHPYEGPIYNSFNFGSFPAGNHQVKTIAKLVTQFIAPHTYDTTYYAPPYYSSDSSCLDGACDNTNSSFSWSTAPQIIRYSNFTVIGASTLFFSANPNTITLGQSSTLSWNSSNTSSCSASGAWSGGKPVNGAEGVFPSNTSTYTLSCSGPGGSVSGSATVNVNIPTPSLSFSANPTSITQGQSSTLSWSSQNTTSCSASGAWSGGKALIGSESVSPSQTSTYTLSCSGPGGSVFESVTIKFTGPFCGNGICEAGESYLICPIDCKPQCSDGIDNDGDSKIDYPQDTGCSSSSDNDERKALFQEF